MSIVACKIYDDRIEIASDSIVVHGNTQRKNDGTNGKYAKLCKVNSIVIGGVGSCEELALFYTFCSTHNPASSTQDAVLSFIVEFAAWKMKQTNKPYGQDCDYIIITGGSAFYIESFWVMQIIDYTAIGAGKDYALSALYLGNGVEKAVETACELSIYCEKPIIFMSEPRN